MLKATEAEHCGHVTAYFESYLKPKPQLKPACCAAPMMRARLTLPLALCQRRVAEGGANPVCVALRHSARLFTSAASAFNPSEGNHPVPVLGFAILDSS